MRIPEQRIIRTEDFPSEHQEWLARLIEPLNRFMEDVVTGIDRGVTWDDNIDGMIRTIIWDGSAQEWDWKPNRKPAGLFICDVKEFPDIAVPSGLTLAITPLWEFTQEGRINVTQLLGLTASSTNKYQITFLSLVG